MVFTARSYARMAAAIPVAGSAYTYTQRTFGAPVGFLAGWSLLLDYLFLPMLNYLVIGIYLNAAVPALPAWVIVLVAIAHRDRAQHRRHRVGRPGQLPDHGGAGDLHRGVPGARDRQDHRVREPST